jgi:hypothetical protein
MMFGWWGFGAVMMVICIILMGRMRLEWSGHGDGRWHGLVSRPRFCGSLMARGGSSFTASALSLPQHPDEHRP